MSEPHIGADDGMTAFDMIVESHFLKVQQRLPGAFFGSFIVTDKSSNPVD